MNNSNFPQIMLLLYLYSNLLTILEKDFSLCNHSIHFVGGGFFFFFLWKLLLNYSSLRN